MAMNTSNSKRLYVSGEESDDGNGAIYGPAFEIYNHLASTEPPCQENIEAKTLHFLHSFLLHHACFRIMCIVSRKTFWLQYIIELHHFYITACINETLK